MESSKLGLLLVVGAIVAGGLYYASELLMALIFSQAGPLEPFAKSSATQAALRLVLLLALGWAAIRRVNGARWALVFFFGVWSLERMYWAARGFRVSAIIAPVFVLCALALASRPSSRFIKGAV
jgi:hypothetical protein